MSLTSFIKLKDVSERFAEEFTKPEFSVNKPMLVPPISKRLGSSSMVGTAFDYLLRFRLKRLNPQSIERRPWIAEEPLKFYEGELAYYKGDEKYFNKYERAEFAKLKSIITNANNSLSKYLDDGKLSDSLINSTLELATLDSYERSGCGEESIGIIYPEDAQDLRSLYQVVNEEEFKTEKLCLLNPTFGSASKIICGADADLVIDETIIDIKTTRFLKLGAPMLKQIVGYYVLHQLGSIGELKPKAKISKLAIYFSRFGYLHTMNVSDIVNPKSFPKFLKWFEKRAKEEWPPGEAY